MPFHKGISNKYQFQINTNFQKIIRHWKLEIGNWKFSNGFSLVEILLSVFLILAILSVVLTAAGTYLHSRITSLETTATGIASRDIENQRKAGFASVSSNPISDSELSKLPGATATRTVSTYDSNNNIKKVADIVSWTEKGATRQIILETLISANGL